MDEILDTAIQAALASGKHIIEALNKKNNLNIREKGLHDYVSDVDKKSEAIVTSMVRKAFPDHGILAEEGTQIQGGDYQWIIDPLDGTTNFINEIPHFTVSIGILYKQNIQYGVVYDVCKNELFIAEKDKGAYLNGQRLSLPKNNLRAPLLIAGFPLAINDESNAYFSILQRLLSESSGLRSFGSAASDLAYIACSRAAGYLQYNLKPWDIAAGILLVQEAGGTVSGFFENDMPLKSGRIVAANQETYKIIMSHIESNTQTKFPLKEERL